MNYSLDLYQILFIMIKRLIARELFVLTYRFLRIDRQDPNVLFPSYLILVAD